MSKFKNFLSYNWFVLTVAVILGTAVLTRFYQLGQIPHGMTWDEAAIGYNGFAIAELHRDEWLRFMPISFQSFGDYKAPLAIYLNGLFTFLFGMNLVAVRLPFALSSILAIAGLGVLVWLILAQEKIKFSRPYILIAMALLTFSPWHLHYSRAGFESGMALSWLVLGMTFLLAHQNQSLQSNAKSASPLIKMLLSPAMLLFLAIGFLVASMYTYHSAKIVAPLLGIAVVAVYRDYWLKNIRWLIGAVVLAGLFLSPMAIDSVYGPGAERLTQTSVLTTDQPLPSKLLALTSNYLRHFYPDYLVLGYTTTFRHGTGKWGVLLPSTLVLVMAGLVVLANKKKAPLAGFHKLALMGVIWLLVGTIPAALGADEVPHSNRALLALPGFILLATAGAQVMVDLVTKTKLNQTVKGNHGEKNTVRDATIGAFTLVHLVFFLAFWQHYLAEFASSSAVDFQDGYLETFGIVTQYEKALNGKPEVDKIMFSSEYGQPYIYALFVRQTTPEFYRGGSLIKYEFTDVNIGDLARPNTLVVATQQDDDLPADKADHVVYGSDGSARFKIFYSELHQ